MLRRIIGLVSVVVGIWGLSSSGYGADLDKGLTFYLPFEDSLDATVKGGIENPDFQFEISKEDFTKLMTGKAYGLILMATKKMKMTKGSWAEINKIATPLSAIPKFGKQIATAEKSR